MKTITKEQVLENLEDVKKYITEADQEKKEERVVALAIKNRWTGSIIFQSTKTTYREAVMEQLESNASLHGADLSGADLHGANLNGADLSRANLSGANLRDANLRDAEMQNVKFYGRGGTKPLKRSQLPAFLAALGFIIKD